MKCSPIVKIPYGPEEGRTSGVCIHRSYLGTCQPHLGRAYSTLATWTLVECFPKIQVTATELQHPHRRIHTTAHHGVLNAHTPAPPHTSQLSHNPRRNPQLLSRTFSPTRTIHLYPNDPPPQLLGLDDTKTSERTRFIVLKVTRVEPRYTLHNPLPARWVAGNPDPVAEARTRAQSAESGGQDRLAAGSH